MFSVSSCTSSIQHELDNDTKNEQIYLAVKNEMKAGLRFSILKSYSETNIENYIQNDENVSVPSIKDYTEKIESLNVTESTKSFLYNLPIVFLENNHKTTLDDINSYSIPQSEKELMIKAVAMIDAITELDFYYESNTRARGREEYEEAVRHCIEDYYEDLGIAVGEAVIAGGLGAFGGPVTAGVSCAVVGVWNVGKAYYSWRKCKSRAKELL